DCKKEMDMVNKAFIEIMIEGDANGRGFQYPIPTYSITRDFDWSETENNKLLFEMTAKYGTPYFSNYINSDMEPSDVRSMCCRLRLDLRELRKKSGGFFGSGESTGSIGVVTINMPRIAYLAETKEDFYKRLDHMMDIAARSLRVKREVITGLLEKGLYPYTKRYLGTFANHFSTIGLVGMNEAGLNAKWLKKDLTHKEAQDFAKEVLNHMRERLSDYQEMYGDLYNLEATPAESTSYRLAKHDKKKYPDIITANEACGTPYYTNSSHLPVGYTSDIFDALDVQDDLQTLYTSGTVFHAFLGEKLPSWQSAAKLVRTIAENYKLPYYTMSPTYSVCAEHGYLIGEHFECPICGKKAEVYSRITGYYRPVQNWNDGKSQEYKDRKEYDVESSYALHSGIKPAAATVTVDLSEKENIETEGKTISSSVPTLFKTSTCPNCKLVCAKFDQAGIKYETVNCTEDPDTAKKYGIKQAPTLIVGDEKIAGASNIIKWMNETALVK
ncbi:MAG: ribonucleoside triphosphate reductase, partial [Lachnospiraceae bacterium]|nr:ribonucleoside triphosphate reductase [Lachnospiraceae bacterium]